MRAHTKSFCTGTELKSPMDGDHSFSPAGASGLLRGRPGTPWPASARAAASCSSSAVKVEVGSPPSLVKSEVGAPSLPLSPRLSVRGSPDDGTGLGLPSTETRFVLVGDPLPVVGGRSVPSSGLPPYVGSPHSVSGSSVARSLPSLSPRVPPPSPLVPSPARACSVGSAGHIPGMSAYDGASEATIEVPRIEPFKMLATELEKCKQECSVAKAEAAKAKFECARLHAALRNVLHGSVSQHKAMLAYFEEVGGPISDEDEADVAAVFTPSPPRRPAPAPPPGPSRKRSRNAAAPSARRTLSFVFG